jgi:two-component system NtrC family response regulator
MNEERRINVLLVDDEEDLVDLLALRMAKRNIDAVATNSGNEALAEAERRSFDVAVIDLKMPQMDGVEVMKRLKTAQPYLECIMFTGHGTTESALEAGRLEAFRYVMKPCPFDELVEIIRSAYARRRQRLRERFQVELQQALQDTSTSQDIIEAGERLRRKYDQD